MNSILALFVALFAVVSAAPKPLSEEAWKSGNWADGGVSYSSPVAASSYGYWSSYSPSNVQYSPSVQYAAEVAPKSYYGSYSAAPVVASRASEWSAVPQTWNSGYYSAAVPTYSAAVPTYSAGFEKQVVSKKVVAPVKVDQYATVSEPKPMSYSTEITHDIPAKKEEVTRVVAAPQQVTYTQQAPKVVSAPVQYASWADVKPVEVKATTEIKPTSWSAEVKPTTFSWAEPKPMQWGAWMSDPKPVSYSSWSEAKPMQWGSWMSDPKPASWSSYVSPVQPAFYGASWGASEPTISTNAHVMSMPWSSTWASGPVSWSEPIQKRSERKPF